jgi:MraZ protein
MFLGEYVHTIDEKGRLTIPARFRGELAAGVVVTRGMDRCLTVYPMDEWNRLAKKVSELPVGDRRARTLRRLVFGGAADVVPDKQGRVLIPPNLREYARLDGEVIVTGLHTYVEVWNLDSWREERKVLEEERAEATEWAELGV